jgi:hypothetical protein
LEGKMSIFDFLNFAKHDPFNRALDKWEQLHKIDCYKFANQYLSLLIEVIELCKQAIRKSPGWGDQYILLAHAYLQLFQAFPRYYGAEYLIYAKAVISKWEDTDYLINKDNQVRGLGVAMMIGNRLDNFGNKNRLAKKEMAKYYEESISREMIPNKYVEMITYQQNSFIRNAGINPKIKPFFKDLQEAIDIFDSNNSDIGTTLLTYGYGDKRQQKVSNKKISELLESMNAQAKNILEISSREIENSIQFHELQNEILIQAKLIIDLTKKIGLYTNQFLITKSEDSIIVLPKLRHEVKKCTNLITFEMNLVLTSYE